MDLGLPPVLHERKLGENNVTRRCLQAADITQDEFLDAAGSWELAGGHPPSGQLILHPRLGHRRYCFGIS